LEQENNHFYHNNLIFLNFVPLGHPEDSNIFENFLLFFLSTYHWPSFGRY